MVSISDKAWAIVYSALVFGSGIAAGGLISHVRSITGGSAAIQVQVPAAAPRQPYVEQFRWELMLNDAQSRQLDTILDETSRQYSDVYEFTRALHTDTTSKIRAILNDNQQQRFDRLLKPQARPAANQPLKPPTSPASPAGKK